MLKLNLLQRAVCSSLTKTACTSCTSVGIIQPRNYSAQQEKTSIDNVTKKFTRISIDPKTKVAILTLDKPPANALSLEFMREIKAAVHYIEDEKCRGLILTSASERIFCAGLDLNLVYQPNISYIKDFWTSLQDMWQAMFSTMLPTVALINGHAIAGGCMITTACEHRIMLPNFMIGLNETKAGIAVPRWVADSYEQAISSRRIAERDIIEGRLYNTADAFKAGLIDEIAATKEEGWAKCMEFFGSFKGVNAVARGMTKVQFRADILEDFENDREADLERFVENIQRDEVQKFLGEYLKNLKAKSSKKQ